MSRAATHQLAVHSGMQRAYVREQWLQFLSIASGQPQFWTCTGWHVSRENSRGASSFVERLEPPTPAWPGVQQLLSRPPEVNPAYQFVGAGSPIEGFDASVDVSQSVCKARVQALLAGLFARAHNPSAHCVTSLQHRPRHHHHHHRRRHRSLRLRASLHLAPCRAAPPAAAPRALSWPPRRRRSSHCRHRWPR